MRSARRNGGLLALILPLALCGCIVRTAANVATFPVRATGWTYDRLTVSQAEADRNRGRRERKAEQKQAKEQRRLAREQRRAAERAQAQPR